MFADFVEFMLDGAVRCINRTNVNSMGLFQDWNRPAHVYTNHVSVQAAFNAQVTAPPPVIHNQLHIKLTNGDELNYAFPTEEAALAAYRLIRDGYVP